MATQYGKCMQGSAQIQARWHPTMMLYLSMPRAIYSPSLSRLISLWLRVRLPTYATVFHHVMQYRSCIISRQGHICGEPQLPAVMNMSDHVKPPIQLLVMVESSWIKFGQHST